MASPAKGHPALIEDYFRRIETLVADAGMVRFFNITYDKRMPLLASSAVASTS